MVYVLKSPIYNKDTHKYELAIKIGHTDSWSNRLDTYLLHNPAIQVIKTYEDGTLDDETLLKKYFRPYLVHRSEWFKYCKSILDFFNKYNTIEDIRRELSFIKLEEIRPANKRYFYIFACSIKDVVECKEGIKTIIENMFKVCKYDEESALMYICDKYPDYAPMIIQNYEDNKSSLTEEMIDMIAYLQNTSIKFSVRLKTLCESEFTDQEKSSIARQASESFDKFYNILGPSDCRRFGYNITLMESEVKNKIITKDIDVIKESFLRSFKVGDRKTKSDFKQDIQNIYNELGISKNAKASDLNDYFELKEVKITIPGVKKQENGFKILGLK